MCPFTLESTHFIFNKCPIYTHDGANAKFSTNSHETDYSVVWEVFPTAHQRRWRRILVQKYEINKKDVPPSLKKQYSIKKKIGTPNKPHAYVVHTFCNE
jgi:hypothetical protein